MLKLGKNNSAASPSLPRIVSYIQPTTDTILERFMEPNCPCKLKRARDRFYIEKWELIEVIKRRPKSIPLIFEIDLICWTPQQLQPCVSKFRDIKKKTLRNCLLVRKKFPISFNNRTSRYQWFEVKRIPQKSDTSLFCKKFCKVILFWWSENSKRRVANGTESNGLYKSIFADKGNRGTRFATHVYYLKYFSCVK